MNWFFDNLKIKHRQFCDNLSTKISQSIKNGGWIIILIADGFGILMATAGMFMSLIDIYHNCGLGAFISCTIIGVLVLSTTGVGIYGIVSIIKKHKDLFKW